MATRPVHYVCASLRRATSTKLPHTRLSPLFASKSFAGAHLPSLRRAYSAENAPPPLLQKLKGELKTAMRAKDGSRLIVLRAIMSANLNASKTASPIQTDAQLVALIRKIQQSGRDAVADAQAAGRQDLVEKEEAQLSIMREYIESSGIVTIGEAEIDAAVGKAIEAIKEGGAAGKSIVGDVMKRLSAEFEGKDVDRKALSKKVTEALKG